MHKLFFGQVLAGIICYFVKHLQRKNHIIIVLINNQRIIEVEHGSFSPLVFTPYGGSGREAERFLAELAHKVSENKHMSYSTVIGWLRAKLSFNLLRISCAMHKRFKSTQAGV